MTPTQSYLAAANQTQEVITPTGQTLTIRRPTTLDRLRLFKAVGPTLSNNERYLGTAMLVFTVIAIDAVPFPQPTNEHQIEAAIAHLGDPAINAIADALDPQDREGLATAAAGN